jgi:hypothetical protein
METDEQQRQKATSLKEEIKHKAALRREKSNTSTSRVIQEDATHQFNIIPDIVAPNNPSSISPNEQTSISTNISTPPTVPPFPFSLLPNNLQHYHPSHTVSPPSPIESDFISKYLDYVFPALFPFYRPSLFDTGRSWLLQLLGSSQIAHHAALSMSCYFFTMALVDLEGASGEHAECRLLRWDEVEMHTQRCFESLRTDMLALGLNIQAMEKLERVGVLGNVVHVLIFQMALGKAAPWKSHLPPAFALFKEILAADTLMEEDQQSKLTSALLDIGPPLWTNPLDGTHIWSPAQSGFRFSAALLMFVDVIASTALQDPPTLLPYHTELLAERDDGSSLPSDAEIRLSTVVGCRNGAIRCIAEISILSSWKKNQQVATDSLNAMDLVNRASHIASSLKNIVSGLQNENTSTSSVPGSSLPRGLFDITPNPAGTTTTSLIWSHAAQIYLTVVASGWQLSNQEMRTNVAQIIALLQHVPAHQLRALAWPVCVAGCLAMEEEEQAFLRIFRGLGKVNTAGALDDARQIVEKVWERRGRLDGTNWDLGDCFRVLGAPILLV